MRVVVSVDQVGSKDSDYDALRIKPANLKCPLIRLVPRTATAQAHAPTARRTRVR